MKNTILLTLCLLAVLSGKTKCQVNSGQLHDKGENSVYVSATPEIESLVRQWVEAYEAANPGTELNMRAYVPSSEKDILFTTNSLLFSGTSDWQMAIGRDITVPVISAGNSFADEICSKGISPEKYKNLVTGSGAKTWGTLLGSDMKKPVTCLIKDEESIVASVSRFVGQPVEMININRYGSASELAELLLHNPDAIGFCKLADITSKEKQEIIPGIKIIPVDINNNGSSDYFEQFYSDLASFNRGVYIGKYPKTLYNNIFAVSRVQPADGSGLAFINFILSEGQNYLSQNGFTGLASGEIQSKRAALTDFRIIATPDANRTSVSRAFFWIASVFAVIFLIAYAVYRFIRSGSKIQIVSDNVHNEVFNEKTVIIPKGLFFDKTHTWAFMEKDGVVKIGIDDFLQHITGTITRVKMKVPGERIRKGEQILSLIQNGKQLNIYSPVSGKITMVNETLATNSSMINSSPYNEGWIYSIEPENWLKETGLMIMADAYVVWIRGEFTRLKDFLAASLGSVGPKYSQVVLQDGGELKDSLLEDLGPETWEDFQTKFIDSSR